MAIVVKSGDTAPTVRAVLLDATQAPVDINGADVRFVVATKTTPRNILIDKPAVVSQISNGDDGSRGMVEYKWATGDTATIGEFDAEWEVEYIDGTVQTFPTEDYLLVRIVDDLGGIV